MNFKVLLGFFGAIALSTSATAFASNMAYSQSYRAEYTLDTISDTGQVYYSCSSVEDTTGSVLEKLGAEDIHVSCTGGLDPYTNFSGPAEVTAEFVAPSMVKNASVPRAASIHQIKLQTFDGCDFMTKTIQGLSSEIDLNVISGPGSCNGSLSADFLVQVLAFD